MFFQAGEWVVRDLGSTNGTWVNGSRLKGDQPLMSGDVIRFGATGPQLSFQARDGEPPTVPVTRREPAAPVARRRPNAPSRAEAPVAEGPGSKRKAPGAGWKRLTIGIVGLALVVSAGLLAMTAQKNQADAAERAVLLARTDSLLARIDATAATVSTLSAALQAARAETEQLRGEVAQNGAAPNDSLGETLRASLTRHEDVVRAAELDRTAIATGNADAVGVVVIGFADGHWVTGTGFGIRVRGDTGWIATARHLVADSAGRPATRLGIIFNGSAQHFRADLAGVSDSADLAVLKVWVRGGVPVVRSLHGAVRGGDPIAIFGFPNGFDLPSGGDWKRDGVRVAQFSGSIRRVGPDRLELNGYGASGSSGSPVFASDGAVAGVVFGGVTASGDQTVYAVPVRFLDALLSRLGLAPE